jgi:WXXGXW repeat (2 copies)
MRLFLKTTLLAAILLACVSGANAQISIGIRIGPPPAPRVVRVEPARPGADFMWVDGYWYPVGHHYKWHEGYWSRPPYAGAHWVAPHHDGTQYFAGYWDGDHGHVDHDHRWDRDHDRDFHHDDHRNDHHDDHDDHH